MMDRRTTADAMADLPDAGCCTGMDVPSGTGVTRAALDRGFVRINDRLSQFPHMLESPNGDVYPIGGPRDGGFLGRPGGWER